MPNKTITSIICITILLGLAVWQGVDTAFLYSGLAILAGLGGLALFRPGK